MVNSSRTVGGVKGVGLLDTVGRNRALVGRLADISGQGSIGALQAMGIQRDMTAYEQMTSLALRLNLASNDMIRKVIASIAP